MIIHTMKARTTLLIDKKLFQLAKKKSVETGIPLGRIVEDALRASLVFKKPELSQFRLDWNLSKSKTLSGVDISDRDSLYEKMGSKK